MKYVLVMWLLVNNGVTNIMQSQGDSMEFQDCVNWAISIKNSVYDPSKLHYVCAPE